MIILFPKIATFEHTCSTISVNNAVNSNRLINIEAQACGCPVIGSRAAGIAEYTKENETSLLFDVGEVDGCFLKMRALLSDEKLQQSLSENGKIYAKEFSWDNIASEY